MIRSMTAFARQEDAGAWGAVTWELRSVNSRYLDVNTRLPEDFRVLEPIVRDHVSARVSRGKLDCSLRFQPGAEQVAHFSVNTELVSRLAGALNQIGHQIDQSSTPSAIDIMRWPGVIEASAPDVDIVAEEVLRVLDTALSELVDTRMREGQKISELLAQRCQEVDSIVQQIQVELPMMQRLTRERLFSRLTEVSDKLDNDRLEQEMVIFAQKMDVSEELERLATHVVEVRRVLAQDKPVGRRLDFLMQEMNREANTLGSKAVHAHTTQASVELKVLIEQMREQIQNIE